MAVYARTPRPNPRLSRLESDRHLAVSLREWGRAREIDAEISRLKREEHDRMLVKVGRVPNQ